MDGFTGVLQIDARFMARRLRQIPGARTVFGLWFLSEHDIAEAEDAVRNIGADLGANPLRQAVDEVGLLGEDMSYRP